MRTDHDLNDVDHEPRLGSHEAAALATAGHLGHLDRTEQPMNLQDSARVRQPRDKVEYRLGTVNEIIYPNPHTTYVGGIRLAFPTGEERTYRPEDVVACSRADDHAALVAAFTETCRTLRDACRIAHDYDTRLSGDIIGLLMALLGVAATRLGLTLDPADLDPPTGGDGGDEVRP